MYNNKQYSLDLISELCVANGVSGFEDEVVEIGKKHCKDFADLKENSLRNLYISRKSNTGKKPIVMLDAHSDELGFVVQNINPNGTIAFLPIGGWMATSLPAHRVRILNADGEYIIGVIATKPPHFMTAAEKSKELTIKEMVIDVGASSKQEIENTFKIRLGAPIIPDVGFEYNEKNGVIRTKALDNRLGCAAVVESIKNLSDVKTNIDIIGSFTSQEEIGRRGTPSAINFIKPDVAIIFEGSPADDTFMSSADAQCVLGKGVQIRHFDVGMVGNPRFTRFALDIAQKNQIKCQEAVRSGGGTNAGYIHTAEQGIPCIVLGVPVRYAHSHHCYCTIEDYQSALDLAREIIKALDADIIKSF